MENKEKFVSVKELERELESKELLKNQMETALQQIYGQIVCLRNLIKKANNEETKNLPENKK